MKKIICGLLVLVLLLTGVARAEAITEKEQLNRAGMKVGVSDVCDAM